MVEIYQRIDDDLDDDVTEIKQVCHDEKESMRKHGKRL